MVNYEDGALEVVKGQHEEIYCGNSFKVNQGHNNVKYGILQ